MKLLLKLIAVLVVILVVVAGATLYYLDSAAKKAIEYGGTEALGVNTTLDGIRISLFGGEARLNGLNIANPKGYAQPTFMSLGDGELAVSLGSLNRDTIVIPKVRFADILVNLEQKNRSNNIEPILDHVKKMGGSAASSSRAAASEGPGKKFILEYLAIENVKVDAALDLLGRTNQVKLVLPKIELRNLGKDKGGMPMEELVQTVVQVILDAAAKSSANLSPELAGLLRGELQGLDSIKTELIGKATGEVGKQLKEVQEQVGDQMKKLPLSEDAGKAVEEKAGKLLKGVFDKQ